MLKGKTKIELTDVHTGNVEVVEEENMVTNALQYYFSPMIATSGNITYATDNTPFHGTLTGGLLLLNKSLEENVDNLFLPEDVEQTGCAVYDKQNSSDQTLRGNYNATESTYSYSDRIVKYVYDFDTAEGNGTIASVALTHANGGYSNRGCAETPVRGLYPFFVTLGTAYLRYTGDSSGINAVDRIRHYSIYGNKYKWIVKLDATNDSVYYFTIESTTSITIQRYRANIKTVSIFDNPISRRTLLDETSLALTTEINQIYFSYSYDEDSDKLYIVSASNCYVSDNGSYMITEINMSDDTFSVKQYAMTNICGGNMRAADGKYSTYCYRGYIYFVSYSSSDGSYYIWRQEIGNSANISKLGNPINALCYPTMAREGRVYFEYIYYSTCLLYVINTKDFSMKIPESYSLYDKTLRQYVPVIGYPLIYYLTYGSGNGVFACRTDYLATINNLSEPVLKTADKTMKVTYTLQEV